MIQLCDEYERAPILGTFIAVQLLAVYYYVTYPLRKLGYLPPDQAWCYTASIRLFESGFQSATDDRPQRFR